MIVSLQTIIFSHIKRELINRKLSPFIIKQINLELFNKDNLNLDNPDLRL